MYLVLQTISNECNTAISNVCERERERETDRQRDRQRDAVVDGMTKGFFIAELKVD